MPDDQQEANCIIGVCCGKDGKQLKALTHRMARVTGLSLDDARTAAAFMLEGYDLAVKGTLQPFKDSIAALARGNPYE